MPSWSKGLLNAIAQVRLRAIRYYQPCAHEEGIGVTPEHAVIDRPEVSETNPMEFRRTILLTLTLVLGLLVASGGSSSAHGQDPLQWKFTEGDVRLIELKQLSESNAVINGQERKIKTEQILSGSWTVKSTEPDGSARLGQKIDRIRLSVESSEMQFQIDTDDDQEQAGVGAMMAPFFEILTDAEINLLMTPTGEITDVEIPDSMMEKIQQAGAITQGLQSLTTKEGVKALFGQSTLKLPTKPLVDGDTWETTDKLSSPVGTFSLTNTYTFEGTKGAIAQIGLVTAIEKEATPNPGFDLPLNRHKATGLFQFDVERGMLASSEVEQLLELKGNIQGQEFVVVQHSETTFRWVNSEDSPQ